MRAILKASADAGIDPREIDGFASYSNDRNDPSRIAAALDIKDLRFSNMEWGGGGGGGSAACAHAASAVATGLADTVVVFRGLAQGQFGRFGQGARVPHVRGDQAYTAPYGLMSPAQSFAMRVHRLYEDHGITQDTLKACSLASYHHAQKQPARRDVRASADARGLRRLALDRGNRSTCSTAVRRTTARRR